MKRTKKVLCLAMAMTMTFSLAACGGQSTGEASSEAATEPVTEAQEDTVEETTAEAAEETEEGEGFVLVDASDREVEFAQRPERIAVINRYNLELIRACGYLDQVVGVDESIIENSIYWPEFTEDMSYGAQDAPDMEKIVELAPDVILTPFVNDELVNSMDAFGIPVVSLIGYDANMSKQVGILTELLGENDQAQQFLEFYETTLSTLNDAVASIPEDEIKIGCWESIKEYSVVSGDNAWSEMLEMAGVKNAFADTDLNTTTIDAEAMIAADLDVAFKMVAASGVDLSGYTAPSAEDYQAAADDYMARPGFDLVPAVENGDVYFVTSFAFGGMGKLLGACRIANLVYPEYTESVDANEVFRIWLETYQNIDFVDGHVCRLGDLNG